MSDNAVVVLVFMVVAIAIASLPWIWPAKSDWIHIKPTTDLKKRAIRYPLITMPLMTVAAYLILDKTLLVSIFIGTAWAIVKVFIDLYVDQVMLHRGRKKMRMDLEEIQARAKKQFRTQPE